MSIHDKERDTEGKGKLDAEEIEVKEPLRERIVKKLVKKLEEEGYNDKLVEVFVQGNADRADALERQKEYITRYDEFISPIYDAPMDWSSTLHLPITYSVCKTMHARLYQALLGIDPPFTVKARKAANVDRAPLIQELMRYTLNDWINEYEGVKDAVDKWLWRYVTAGTATLKSGWHREFEQFEDVVQVPKQTNTFQTNPQTGELVAVPQVEMVEEEQDVVREIANCPTLNPVLHEDLLIVGGDGCPQKAEYVIEQAYLDNDKLWSLAARGIFDRDAVAEIVESGDNKLSSEQQNQIKLTRDELGGHNTVDVSYTSDKHQILECYFKADIKGNGIASQVVAWVHKPTRRILRATYLYRLNPQGMRPYHKIDFYKREGSQDGVGLVELMYSLNNELDAIHNMKVDTGLLTSLPWGFYRPTGSTVEEQLPIEPGALIPLDNPQADVFFPNLGNRVSFGFQEEQLLQGMIDKVTSISDLNMGILGAQGAARTATGARITAGESNANLDIYIQRMNRGWKTALKYLFSQLQAKIPPGFQFRLLGDDGKEYWSTVESPREIAGMYDFELEPNSVNSNKQIQLDTANQIYQMTGNPIDLQLGIITPQERYEAIKNMLSTMGVRDVSRYIRKPQGGVRLYKPIEIADAVLAGVDIPLDPQQDLAGLVELIQDLISSEDTLGQFNEEQVGLLVQKMREAQALIQALEQQKAQVANIQQQQTNAALGSSAQTLAPAGGLPGAGTGGGEAS